MLLYKKSHETRWCHNLQQRTTKQFAPSLNLEKVTNCFPLPLKPAASSVQMKNSFEFSKKKWTLRPRPQLVEEHFLEMNRLDCERFLLCMPKTMIKNFRIPSLVVTWAVKETNRTRSLSRDKNFETNTKTPFFSPNRKTCVFCMRLKCKEKKWLELKTSPS